MSEAVYLPIEDPLMIAGMRQLALHKICVEIRGFFQDPMMGELQSLFRTDDSVEFRTIIDHICVEFLEGLAFGLGSEESEGFKYDWRHEVIQWVQSFKENYLEGLSDYTRR